MPGLDHVITVIMDGGLIHDIQDIPKGITIRIMDFDVEGADEEDVTVLEPSKEKVLINYHSHTPNLYSETV